MPQKNIYKGSLSTLILKLLSENDKMYGYEITQKVKLLSKGKIEITEGALYPALHKLEAEGFLEAEAVKVENRIRKYYRLTQNGTKESAKQIAELEEFIKTIQGILKPNFNLG